MSLDATIVYLSSIYIVTCQPDRVTCVTEVRNNIRSQPFLYACMHMYVCTYMRIHMQISILFTSCSVQSGLQGDNSLVNTMELQCFLSCIISVLNYTIFRHIHYNGFYLGEFHVQVATLIGNTYVQTSLCDSYSIYIVI